METTQQMLKDINAVADEVLAASLFLSKEAFTKALLDILRKHGWRRCAEGQKVTQYCAYAESLAAELNALKEQTK